MSAHPIRKLFDAGVSVTINSDDPFFFGNRLSEEYYALHQDLGFSLNELTNIAGNGFDVALVDEVTRQRFKDDLASYCNDNDHLKN
jgi:adenosine deaminase